MPSPSQQKLLTLGTIIIGLAFGAWWYAGFSLEFMRFFAAEPEAIESPVGTSEPSPTSTVGESTIHCSPATQTATVGSSVEIVATGKGPFEWLAPEAVFTGEPASAAVISYATPGTKIIVVQSLRDDGSDGVDSAYCAVVVTE